MTFTFHFGVSSRPFHT